MEGETNHKFVDPGVFLDEDKMYKNIELLSSGYIFTCQERPEGAKGFREDLFKKVITGEGIAGRLPLRDRDTHVQVMGVEAFRAQ